MVAANSLAIEGVEASFNETFTGAGSKATPILIGTNGQLAELGTLAVQGNLFELNPAGRGPLLELNGRAITDGQFQAGWTPVGAMQTGNGYEVAFSNGQNQYEVWNTDANGNFTSAATPVVAAGSLTIEGIEASFNETFTGAGSPETPTPIGTNNQLSELGSPGVHGNLFELNPAAGGPLLELNGNAVTDGQFQAGWTPVGAIQTATGYEVAFSVLGANEYEVWNTDANGNFTSAATGILSGASATLEGVEANFGDELSPARPRRRRRPRSRPAPQRPIG